MSIKDEIIKLINAKYRQDPYINDFTQALNICFQKLIDFCESIKNNHYFDKLDDDGIKWWENYLKIVPLSSQSKEDRRARIQAKYLSNGHNQIALIQRVCDSIAENSFQADFVDGKLKITLTNEESLRGSLNKLIEEIDEIKPAHLGYLFLYALTADENLYANIGTIESFYSEFDCRNSL